MAPLPDGTAQAELVRSGEASPLELVDEAIERIERLNPELGAVIHPTFQKARDAAKGELPDGPFRGVPMLIKDILCHTEGDPFHEGMGFLKEIGWTEDEDQELAKRFRAAGFVFCGKTNVPELGLVPSTEPVAYGPTLNPWDTTRSPGGSSGGSAAAVAAGMVAVAHANDGGGSIRIPASSCGLVGLKPSRGRVSLGAEFGDLISGLVHELVVTRSVRDTAGVLAAVEGVAPGDPYGAPDLRPTAGDPGKLRIGFGWTAPGGAFEPDPDCRAAVEDAAELLESLGHEVEAAEPPGLDDQRIVTQFLVRWSAGCLYSLRYWEQRTGKSIGPDDVEPATWALAEAGREHSGADYLAAMYFLQGSARRAAEWWDANYDLYLCPTMGEPPTEIGSYEGPEDQPLFPIVRATPIAGYCVPYNVSGQPAISLPTYWNEQGWPIGTMLGAAYGREDLLLKVAAQVEEARPWAARTPPVHVG